MIESNHKYSFALAVLLAILLGLCGQARSADDWAQFRGPGARSIAEVSSLPTDFSIAEGRNVRWTADLPGRGVSSPIVAAGRVFVTASSGPNRDRLHVLAFDAADGRLLWRRNFWATGRTVCDSTSANAAPTPASDGERVFAFFSSNDLICLSVEGDLLWCRGLALQHPQLGNDFGMASSPVVAGPAVVVQCECQGDSFAAGFDRATGKALWEAPRPRRATWTSPVALNAAEKGNDSHEGERVLLQSPEGIALHDAATGALQWEAPIRAASISSLTYSGDRLFVPADGLSVLRLNGDVAPVVEWEASTLQPSSPSPVVVEDRVLVINRSGVLTCADATTSETQWRRRLGGNFWATPVVVAGRIYCFNDDGVAFVVDLANGKITAESAVGEPVLASPAVAQGGMFIRTEGHLYKIGTGAGETDSLEL